MTREEACAVLRLPLTFDKEMLKSAYRERTKETHPDKGGTAEEFKRVKEAYEWLKTQPLFYEAKLTHSTIFTIKKK